MTKMLSIDEVRAREKAARDRAYRKKLEKEAPPDIDKAQGYLEVLLENFIDAVEGMEDNEPQWIDVKSLQKELNKIMYRLKKIGAWQKLQKLRDETSG